MRMRKKKNLAPRMEACGMYLIKETPSPCAEGGGS